MSRFILSARARLDYFEALDFIASYSVPAAYKWEASVLEALAHLAHWPQTGKVRPEFAPPFVRFWAVGDYLVLYKATTDPVEVIAVLQGSQDMPNLIASRLREEDLDPTQ